MNRKRIGGIGATVLALGALGGTAYAAVPDSAAGTVTTCSATTGTAPGTLKIIAAQSGAICAAGQIKLTWAGQGWRSKGACSSATTYHSGDVVNYQGGSYVAVATNVSTLPSVVASWGQRLARGKAGVNGVSGYRVVTTLGKTVIPHDQGSVRANCAPGEIAIVGGEGNNGFYNSVLLTDSFQESVSSWRVYVSNPSVTDYTFYAYARCANAA